MNTMAAVRAAPGAVDNSPGKFFVMRYAVFAILGISVLMVFYRMYQQMFGFTYGTDSTLPEFDTYWMTLMKVELTLIIAAYIGLWSYIWFTRDKHLDQLSAARRAQALLHAGVLHPRLHLLGLFCREPLCGAGCLVASIRGS